MATQRPPEHGVPVDEAHEPKRGSRLRGIVALGFLLGVALAAGGQCSLPDPELPGGLNPLPDPPDLAAPANDLSASKPPVDPNQQWNQLFLQETASDFAAWQKLGVAVKDGGGGAEVRLSPSATALPCDPADIDGGQASFDAAAGLCAGTEPTVPGLPAGVTYYSGAPFYFGSLRSPEVKLDVPIDHLIASWNAVTPPETWLQVHVRVKLPSGYTGWYRLPIWSSEPTTVKRHSVKLPSDDVGGVDVDTFFLKNQLGATAYELSVTLFSSKKDVSPTLHRVAAIASRDRKEYPSRPSDPSVHGTNLPVPQRSQELPEYKGKGYGGGGEVWCSPTSTSMVMEYFSAVTADSRLNKAVPDAAAGCYDWVYDGTGNWPFNTAYAAGLDLGLAGFVTRLYSMSDAEKWIAAGVPLIISISFKAGELPGAPISKTNGHLIVVRGFDKNGDVIVNDPAARDNASVQLIYPRAALEAAWGHSHRTAYIIYPTGWQKTHRLPIEIEP
jgi:hypothetical protein